MDFAIAQARTGGGAQHWDVMCLTERRGVEVAAHLASFGYRRHAEAFLADLLADVVAPDRLFRNR